MRTELAGYRILEHELTHEDLTLWQPDDPEDFSILLDFYARPVGETWAEAFTVRVCSPKHFFRENADKLLSGTHVLFIDRFDGSALLDYLEKTCAQIEGDSWEEQAMQLNMIGKWEFLYRAVLDPIKPPPGQLVQSPKVAGKAPGFWQRLRSKLPF
jgi:hypothetical protein